MKKVILILFVLASFAVLAFQFQPVKKAVTIVTSSVKTPSLVNRDSLTIASRVNLPEDYKRVTYKKGSFQDYLRTYKLKPFGSKIINYDNTNYF